MSKQTYDESLRRLLADEGGYGNHPSDPGGPTNFGITIIDYRKYVKTNATAADVKAMKVSEAKAIYRAKYWDVQRCDDLPAGVDYAIFDYGVNSGIGRSGKVLRRLLGLPANTSAITDEVIAACKKRDPAALVAAICDERLAFLKSLKTWPVFGKGWGRRVMGVKVAATVMAGRPTAPAIARQPVPSGSVGKGQIPAPNTTAITHGGPAAALPATFVLWDWIAAHPVLSTLIAAALLTGIVAALNAFKAARVVTQETPPADLKPVPELVAAT